MGESLTFRLWTECQLEYRGDHISVLGEAAHIPCRHRRDVLVTAEVNERHLRRILTVYLHHFNAGPHRALAQLTPAQTETPPHT